MKLQKKILVATIALALAGVTGSAIAGTASSTFSTYATEAISVLNAVPSPTMAYEPGQLVAQGTNFVIYIRLNGGAAWVTPPSSSNITLLGAAFNSAALNQSKTVLALNFSSTAVIPSTEALSISAGAATIDLHAASALKTSGGTVKADFAFANGTSAGNPVFPTSPLDTASGIVANSKQAITTQVFSSADYAAYGIASSESAKIDVSANPPLSTTTSTGLSGTAGLVNFGVLYVNETSGEQLGGSIGNNTPGSGGFVLTDLTGGLRFTIKGTFLPLEQSFAIDGGASCSGPITGATATLNSTTGNFDVSIPVGSLNTATSYFLCGNINSAYPNTATVPATTPSIASVNQYVGTGFVGSDVGGTLYPLIANGASVTLPYYVPSNAAPGYATYIRVWNKSSLTVAVKGTLISQAGAQLGSTQTIATVPAGGAVILNGKNIEMALGVTLLPSARPTLKVTGTAPSGDLVVQAYQGNPNGTVTNFTASKN